MATRIKRYEERLDQLDELLARIESEMGPNAQLETRQFKRGGFLGLGGQKMVEVIASLEIDGTAADNTAAVDNAAPPDATGLSSSVATDPAPPVAAEPYAAATSRPPVEAHAEDDGRAPAGRSVNMMADNDLHLPVANDEVDSLAALLSASGLREGTGGDYTPTPANETWSPHEQLQPQAYVPAEELHAPDLLPDVTSNFELTELPASQPQESDAAELVVAESTGAIEGSYGEEQTDYETALALDMAKSPWDEPAPVEFAVDEPAVGALIPTPLQPYTASSAADLLAEAEAVASPPTQPQTGSAGSGQLEFAEQPAAQLLEPSSAASTPVVAPPESATKQEGTPRSASPILATAPPVSTPASPEALDQIGELKQSISGLQAAVQQLVDQQQTVFTNATQAAVVAAQAAAQAVVDAERQARADEQKREERRKRNEAVTVDRRAKKAAAQAPAPAPAAVIAERTPSVINPLLLDPAGGFDATQRQVYDRLLDWNIGHYDAIEMINSALTQLEPGSTPTTESLTQAISEGICRNVLLGDGIRLIRTPPGKVVALVGATGVGKTTTVAKLAALFAFQQGKRVSLVSLDNYRIAAAEQLRTYADIMGIDLDIVFSKDEFDAVLTRRRSSDLVLIDTAGRSPNNTKQLYDLRETFAVHPPDEVHLVMAASTKRDDMQLLLDAFLPLSYDHVIVSKLDETRSLGAIYNLTKHCKLPISYFTVGQSVPEDIRTATLPFIQKWISQGRIL